MTSDPLVLRLSKGERRRHAMDGAWSESLTMSGEHR
jgi:hypothetical protein